MSRISKMARSAVYDRLADDTQGLNFYLASIAGDYELSPLSVDFGQQSKSFFNAYVEAETLQQGQPVQYPLALLYTLASESRNTEKRRLYSGPVTVHFQVYLSWRGSQLDRNAEDYCDVMQEAVYRCLNDWEYPWAPPLVYNGQLKLTKSAIAPGGEGWRQSLVFQIPFDLHSSY